MKAANEICRPHSHCDLQAYCVHGRYVDSNLESVKYFFPQSTGEACQEFEAKATPSFRQHWGEGDD